MPIFCRFRDITRPIYWSKIGIFSPFLPTPVSFEAIASDVSWGLIIWYLVIKDYSPWTTGGWKLHETTVISFKSILACGGRTDRQMDTPPKSHYSIAEREKMPTVLQMSGSKRLNSCKSARPFALLLAPREPNQCLETATEAITSERIWNQQGTSMSCNRVWLTRGQEFGQFYWSNDPSVSRSIVLMSVSLEAKQVVKVIWQKAPHGGPFPG